MTIWTPSDDGYADLGSHDTFAAGAPHNTFSRLRTEDPLHWSDWEHGQGYWSITRHADIMEMNRNTAVFSSAHGIRLEDQTPEAAIARMDRALREFRIRGVSTNIAFVENLLKHPTFLDNTYTTRFIDETPELFQFRKRRDRGTKVLNYIADVTVNGHPETRDRNRDIGRKPIEVANQPVDHSAQRAPLAQTVCQRPGELPHCRDQRQRELLPRVLRDQPQAPDLIICALDAGRLDLSQLEAIFLDIPPRSADRLAVTHEFDPVTGEIA